MNRSQKNHGEALNLSILYLMVFLTPLTLMPGGDGRFELPKLTVLAVFTTLMILAVATKTIIGSGRMAFGGSIGILVAIFIALTTLSFSQAMDSVSGLYGHFGRVDGLVTYGLLVGLFLVVMQLQWRERMLNDLMFAVCGGALVVCLMALPEYFGSNVLGARIDGRIMSTLGNPVFLGSYLVFAFFCAATLAWSRRSKLLAGASGFIFLMIVLTATRSAILGVIVGIIVVTVHQRAAISRLWRPMLLIALLVLSLATVIQTHSGWAGKSNLKQALSLARIRQAAGLRMESATVGLKIIGERPFLGVGPSNFPWAQQKLQSREDARIHGEGWRSDDAHNYWLQTGASLGLPALVALVVALGLAIHKCWYLAMENKLFLALLGGILGFIGTVSFQPANITSLMLFWLFMGIIAAAGAEPSRPAVLKKSFNAGLISIATIAALAISVVLIKTVFADLNYSNGEKLAKQNQAQPAVDSFLRAIALAPHADRYYLRLGNFLIANARLSNDAEGLNDGIYYLDKATQYGRLDPQNWIRLSLGYQFAVDANRSELRVEAVDAAMTSLELAPNWPMAHRAVGAALLKQGSATEAVEYLETAISIDPGYGEGWLWLGLAHETLGESRKAVRAYNQAAKSSSTRLDALTRLRSMAANGQNI